MGYILIRKTNRFGVAEYGVKIVGSNFRPFIQIDTGTVLFPWGKRTNPSKEFAMMMAKEFADASGANFVMPVAS